MKGWNLKEGEILKKELNNEEIIDLFSSFFQKKTKMNNLYKLLFLKSVIESTQLQEKNIFKEVCHNFGKIYWNFTTEMNFCINTSKGKITMQRNFISYIKSTDVINFPKDFNDILDPLKQRYFKNTKKNIKTYVISALYGDFNGILYSFHKKEETIILNKNLEEFMFKNKEILFKLIDYRMIEFLKLVNEKSNLKDLEILKRYHLNIEDDLYEKINLIFNDLKIKKQKSALDIAKKNNDLIIKMLKNLNKRSFL